MKAQKQKNKQAKAAVDPQVQMLAAEVRKMAKQLAEQAPAAQNGTNPAAQRKPTVRTKKGCVQVDHAEIFLWPQGSASFTAQRASANPGHVLLFNWLAQIARAFETYDFRYLRLKYFPRCGSAQAGTVYLALDPKSGDSLPASEAILSTYHIRTQGSMWKEHVLNVPREVLKGQGPKRFLSKGNIADGNLRSLYDVGVFLIATAGASPAGAQIGEVSVEYGVDLYVPAQDPQGNVNAGWVNGGGTMSPSVPFGTTPAFGGYIVDDVSVNTVFLQQMDVNFQGDAFYNVWIYVTGTGLTNLVVTPGSGAAIANVLLTINAAATVMAYHARVTSGDGLATLALTVSGTTVTDCLVQLSRSNTNQTF